MKAGCRRRAIRKIPRRHLVKNRYYFQDRVLGRDANGKKVTAKIFNRFARPLEQQRRRKRQEDAEEAEDPTYRPYDDIDTVVTNHSGSGSFSSNG